MGKFNDMRKLFVGDASVSREINVQELLRSLRSAKDIIYDKQLLRLTPETEGYVQMKEYVKELKEVSYDAEDLLDDVVLHFTVRFPLPFAKTRQINYLRDKLDELGKKVRRGFLKDDDLAAQQPSINCYWRRKYLLSYVNERKIIGREANKKAVMDMLLMSASNFCIQETVSSVVSIVGLQGIGKTTLAQLVFNDPRIETHFDLRLWFCVSEDFDIQVVLRKILSTILNEREDMTLRLDMLLLLQLRIRDKIQGKRFLLVLDDVCCEDPNLWHHLTYLLPIGWGSQILVTSCSKRAAHVASNGRIYELKGLSQEHSCKLFNRVALHRHDDAMRVDIAKQITLKCGNNPFVIKQVALLLSGQHISKWLSVVRDDSTELTQMVAPIILRSFLLLTPELRCCFELCSILPKDYVIEKEVLINMWLALGYLDPLDEAQSMEQLGEHYCSTLLDKYFFQAIQQDEYGNVISFKKYELLNCALNEAGEEYLMLTDTNHTRLLNNKIRHLSIFMHASSSSIELFGQHHPASETLWTIFNLKEYAPCSFHHVAAILSQCTRLRVLDLHAVSMETLPDTFDRVPHLTYLDLSDNEILEKLPTSITKLPCLQILRLRGCKSLKELPEDISKLVNLRTLDIDGCSKLTSMPAGIDNLTCLRRLTMFVAGGDASKKGNEGKLIDLKALVNLNGDLLIKVRKGYLSNMLDISTEGAYILKDAHLQALKILFPDRSSDQGEVHETLLGSLYPNYDIKRIVIQEYLGTKLSAVTLSHSGGSQPLTKLSQLPHLKYLHLLKLWNVESIEGDAPFEITSGTMESLIFFPSLDKLVLEWMPKLKGWWGDVTCMEMEQGGGSLVDGNGFSLRKLILPAFPRLHELRIRLCQNMTYFPPCPRVKLLELKGVNEVFSINGVSAPSNPVAPESSNSRGTNSALEKLIVCYNANVLDSLFGKSVVTSAVDIELKNFHDEESLLVAREGFERCSSSLINLSIHGFYKLKRLSGGGIEHLTNLQSLSIKECFLLDLEEFEVKGEEEGMPWKFLHSLSSLKLDDIPRLITLPKGFQHLTALQDLHVKSCSSLEALGECISFLTSLKTLHIEDCNNLKTLPEILGSMASLRSIHVDDCSNVETQSLMIREILRIKNCPRLQLAALPTEISSVESD